MAETIQLGSYRLSHLEIHEDIFEEPAGEQGAQLGIDYDIFPNQENPHLYLMKLRVEGHTAAKSAPPLRFAAELLAEIQVPSGLEENKRAYAIAYNGGMIMYGILRGQLGMITGVFPAGSILLPALDWQQVILTVAKQKQERAMQSPAMGTTGRTVKPRGKIGSGRSQKKGSKAN